MEKGQRSLAQDDRKLVEVYGVYQRDKASPEAQVPEERWDSQASLVLGIKPLNEEPGTK